MDEIHWEDPPAEVLYKYENKGKYVALTIELRKHPGRWATLPPGAATTRPAANGLAQNVRLGKIGGFGPKGSFDAISHVEPDPDNPERERVKVYVRYKGEPGEPEPTGERKPEPSKQPADPASLPGNGRSGDGDGPPDAPFDPEAAARGDDDESAGGTSTTTPAALAERINGTRTGGPATVLREPPQLGGNSKIRDWARENGFPNLANHGRIPTEVLDAYEDAHP